ncbi:MAG: UDP-N-acetylmuramoyl-tripeptide--D-alanyl-D-alanine ligase [Ponticaulis sp.]|nr:UDP-N-acetylmuramoyl-tripeptide--D-alanyl-D-alanine ligase [Ponticaulis sp.]|tara:strand:- start:57313 stop:58725 length:1413 start_codon:yes stop_codon:yes gene_type:complete
MTQPLWTSEEAASATGGRAEGRWQVNGISIDTRSLQKGDLFVALKDVRDGHDFVPQAYEAGAGACLVSRPINDVPALEVQDTLIALEQLGSASRHRSNAFCCAITGSVGKTSVKEMLAQIFRAAGPAHWNVKSFNNHWGVPLTLARMPRDTKRAVFEIGMNSPGEIYPRSLMVKPHAALITKIAAAHLEGMGTEEAVAREKSAIFAGLEPNGFVILPGKDKFFDFLRDVALDYCPGGRVLTFGGEHDDAFSVGSSSDGVSTIFTLRIGDETVDVSVNATGEHWGDNIAAALLMAKASDIPVQDAARALNGYAPPDGRGNAEWLDLDCGGRALMVDDAYNANPESMRAALAGFALRPAERKIIALGEMKELGPDADALHASLAEPVLACSPAWVMLVGKGMKPLVDALQPHTNVLWEAEGNPLQIKVNNLLISGDALLIKGSNASGMHALADALRKMSADRSLARNGKEGG